MENDPLQPGVEYQRWYEQRRKTRAGGRRARTQPGEGRSSVDDQAWLATAITPHTLRPLELTTTTPPDPPVMGGQHFHEESVQYLYDALLRKLGKGTYSTYVSGWKRWVWYCRARKRNPYLTGRGGEPELAEEERRLLDFIIHQARWLRRAAGTIRTKLLTVKFYHLVAGLPDPLANRPRV